MNGVNTIYTPSYTTGITYVNFNALTTGTKVNLDVFQGYRVLVRGARDFNLATTPIVQYPAGLRMVDATTIRAKGYLVYGDVIYNTSTVSGKANGSAITSPNASTLALNTTANSFSMVANPYVAPVQWGVGSGGSQANTVYGNSTNINGSYWYLDATSGSTGKYLAYNALSGASLSTSFAKGTYNPVYSNAAGYIQPGQAFFIEANGSGNPTVKFTEASKGTTINLKSVFGVTSPLSKLYVSLEKQETGVYSQVDGTAVAFANGFTNTVYGPQDARKFTGANDNLFISDKGMNLSIDGRLPATSSDAIALKISKPSTNSYQLKVDATNYINEGYTPLLFDAFKNTTTAIAGVDSFKFTVDTAVASTYANRFTLLFAPVALPVNSILASASLNNKVATISWNTVGEKNVARYEVEKSTNAVTFTKIGPVSYTHLTLPTILRV